MWSHVDSRSIDIVNILKGMRVMLVFVVVASAYMPTPKRYAFASWVSNLKATRLSHGCSLNFWRMYEFSLLVFFSHPFF